MNKCFSCQNHYKVAKKGHFMPKKEKTYMLIPRFIGRF